MRALTRLAKAWREDAETLRSYGDERGAEVVAALAAQLEEALSEGQRERLTLAEAAEVSGYSKRRLRELVSEGKVENVGEKGRPRFLRGDLPMKPARGKGGGPYSASEDARAILGRIGGRA